MKVLYCLSMIPPTLLYAHSVFFGYIACSFDFLAGSIDGYTSYPLWLILHKRACKKTPYRF